jgi:GT2 family glycosyltransferase
VSESGGGGGERVCAVVVTYNRLALLRECLPALREQTRPLDHVIVVDNASTDGTGDVVAAEFPEFELVRMPENLGGAGGFEEGMRRAYDQGYDWLWLMDDDTIPTPEALAKLLEANDNLAGLPRAAILSSRALDADGNLHALNWVRPKTRSFPDYVEATSRGLLMMRYASFVSLMVHRYAVERYGFPYGDYFIWNDDFEYSGRILHDEAGYSVTDSIVHHKSSIVKNQSGERYYYEVRNKFLALRAGVFGPDERKEQARMAAMVVRGIGEYLVEHKFSPTSLKTVGRGLRDAVTYSPDGKPPGRRAT